MYGFTNYEIKNLILGFCNHHSNTYVKNFLRNKQTISLQKCRKIRSCNYIAKTGDRRHQIAKTSKKEGNSHKNKSISQNYPEHETQFPNLAQQQYKNFKTLEI